MVWRAIAHWILAGCLSASALQLSSDRQAGDSLAAASSVRGPASLPVVPDKSVLDPQDAGPGPSSLPEIVPPIAAPAAVSPVSVLEEYRIQPEDVLQITVYEEPDLTTKTRVTTGGEIHFPLLGPIKVAGLSVMELQRQLTLLLEKDYLVNPQVQVFIETYHARNVFVTGAVNKPGSYPLPVGKPTTLMEAVTMAGGFHTRAAVNKTRIIRIEDGKEKKISVKANDIIKKGDKSKDVEVLPNDVIFVPESFF